MKKQLNNYLLVENVATWLLCSLILFLPFSTAISNILIIIIVLLFFIKFKKNDFFYFIKSNILIKIILVFTLYFVIKLILFNLEANFNYIKSFFYFFLIPVFCSLKTNIKYLKYSLISMTFIVNSISVFYSLKFYFIFDVLPFGDGEYTNLVLFLERPYMGIINIISFFIGLELISKKNKYKNYLFLIILFNIIVIYVISNRITVFSLFLVSIIYFLWYFKAKHYIKISITLIILILSILTLKLNSNLKERLFIENDFRTFTINFKENEPRSIIWSCVFENIKREDYSFIYGFNSYQFFMDNQLICYDLKNKSLDRKNYFLTKQFNTHNQFLDLLIMGGILGCFLFLYFIFYLIFLTKHSFYAFSIIISFLLMLFIENVFHRQFGVLFFIIILSVYLPKSNEKNITYSS